jgi:hypothetical protein
VCHWIQTSLSRHPHNLSYSSSTQPWGFPWEKRHVRWLRPLPKIITESINYPESPRLTSKGGSADRRHIVADNGTRSGDLLGRRRRTRQEHPPSAKGERPRTATQGLSTLPRSGGHIHTTFPTRICWSADAIYERPSTNQMTHSAAEHFTYCFSLFFKKIGHERDT